MRMKTSSKMIVIVIIIAICIVGIRIIKGDSAKNLVLSKKVYCKGVEFKVPKEWKASRLSALTDNERVYQQRDDDNTNVGMEKIFVKYQGRKDTLSKRYAKSFVPNSAIDIESSNSKISGSNKSFQFNYYLKLPTPKRCVEP